jgi:hypothetical protein
MKFLLFAFLLSISVVAFGQVPQGIPYQAIARDNQGNPMANQPVTIQFSLHEASADGQVVFRETQNTTTNAQGLFSLTFGAGVPSVGTFANINWGSGYKFLQVEADFGSGYVDLGTQQLMAVPYALYSGSSGNGDNNQNSNYNPSSDSVLTLVGKMILPNGVYTVPAGEVWEIEAFNPGKILLSYQINNCMTWSSNNGIHTIRCDYVLSNGDGSSNSNFVSFSLNESFEFQSPVYGLYEQRYNESFIGWEGENPCQFCESLISTEVNQAGLPNIQLPLYAVHGDVININGLFVSVSKFK